ncbi:MAG: hypothetical protein K940chlam5_01331 [Candidatus Anoxychlamydiales bacterium]|nr:hypothetical protein [Candidatus Anoxychlamydiales bacterium]
MLESITITNQNKLSNSYPLDIGSLIECMIFYGKTTIIADYSILDQLFHYFGGDKLLRLLKEEYLHIVYIESAVGIFTNLENNIEYHRIVGITSDNHKFQDKLRDICIATPRSLGSARRFAQKLEKHIHVCKHNSLILEGATKSILNQQYLDSSAHIILKELAPNILNNTEFLFKAHQSSIGIEIETNIDFKKINQFTNKEHHLTPATILTHIVGLEAELYFASSYFSELSCSILSEQLAINKIDYLFAKSKKNREQLKNFKQNILINANCIREAANSDAIDLDYLFIFLKKARRLKEIFLSLPPNSDLLKSFYDELTRDTPFQTLPFKILKFVFFTGLGIVASNLISDNITAQVITTTSISAFDAFIINKLVSKWNPNQFITKDIKKLIIEK